MVGEGVDTVRHGDMVGEALEVVRTDQAQEEAEEATREVGPFQWDQWQRVLVLA